MTQLTVIIPVYNERSTIAAVIERFVAASLEDCELIVVDDGSSDGTAEVLEKAIPTVPTGARLISLPENRGKTSAVRAGIRVARGDWIIVQDADLEYDPAQIASLMEAANQGAPNHEVQAVYGRRPSHWDRPSRWILAGGVLLIDVALLVVYRRWVRDHATCYKLVPREVLERFHLESTGFEGCVEITAKLMRSGIPISQVPIEYSPRSAADGKKLTASYGWTALGAVWKYRNWRWKVSQ